MNKPMAGFEIWDIVKVPFPYGNRPVRRQRPALVVAQSTNAEVARLCWALMITSAAHRRWLGDIEIADIAMTGLPAASMVRCARIATIEATAAERIGTLPGALRPMVSAFVAGMLAPG